MNKEVAKIFSRVVMAEKNVKIKLLGDSITHGVGGTGFEQNGEPIVEEFSRNPDGYCWAKMFKEHMEGNFNCTVTNNACTGTTAQFVLEHFDALVDKDDDIVVCTIGTNNRHQYFSEGPKPTRAEHMQRLYDCVLALHDKFTEAGIDVIFVANIPAAAKNEVDGEDYWRVFHMNDVNDIYMKAANEREFPFISMYIKFLEYCDVKNISVDSLLCDGLHPNDRGYDVMYNLLMDEFGIGRKVK